VADQWQAEKHGHRTDKPGALASRKGVAV